MEILLEPTSNKLMVVTTGFTLIVLSSLRLSDNEKHAEFDEILMQMGVGVIGEECILQQSTPIPTPTTIEATISTTTAPDSSTLTAIHQILSDMENEVKTLRNVDLSLAIRAQSKLIKEHYVPADVVDVLQQQRKPQTSAADIRKIKMEQAGKQQETKYTITPSDMAEL
ncbi:hypothetical protein Tco_0826016 [Tanacetum coccineum]